MAGKLELAIYLRISLTIRQFLFPRPLSTYAPLQSQRASDGNS